jgi:hypothetical protein
VAAAEQAQLLRDFAEGVVVRNSDGVQVTGNAVTP